MGCVKVLDSENVYIRQSQIALESGKVMTTYERDMTVTAWLQRSEGTQRLLDVFHTSNHHPSDTNLFGKINQNNRGN